MAAVFALVFLPVLASIALVLGLLRGDASLSTRFAATAFVLLASGVFGGLFRMARRWEHEADT